MYIERSCIVECIHRLSLLFLYWQLNDRQIGGVQTEKDSFLHIAMLHFDVGEGKGLISLINLLPYCRRL